MATCHVTFACSNLFRLSHPQAELVKCKTVMCSEVVVSFGVTTSRFLYL